MFNSSRLNDVTAVVTKYAPLAFAGLFFFLGFHFQVAFMVTVLISLH